MTDKAVIKRNFSRYAARYDRYAAVQRLSGVRLIAKTGRARFEKILDIGCGTGNYTELLKSKFPRAEINALDLSGAMIMQAKDKLRGARVKFVVADAERADFPGKFDLITANASFQWFENLEEALGKYRDLLLPGGLILFSLFGPLTLRELDTSLKELFKGSKAISARGFANKEKIEKALKKYFSKTSVEEETAVEKHGSIWELLNRIKYTGTRGSGINAGGIRKSEIKELEEIYKKKFKDQSSTYQIFYCKGTR